MWAVAAILLGLAGGNLLAVVAAERRMSTANERLSRQSAAPDLIVGGMACPSAGSVEAVARRVTPLMASADVWVSARPGIPTASGRSAT
jgi:hypothetical protein